MKLRTLLMISMLLPACVFATSSGPYSGKWKCNWSDLKASDILKSPNNFSSKIFKGSSGISEWDTIHQEGDFFTISWSDSSIDKKEQYVWESKDNLYVCAIKDSENHFACTHSYQSQIIEGQFTSNDSMSYLQINMNTKGKKQTSAFIGMVTCNKDE